MSILFQPGAARLWSPAARPIGARAPPKLYSAIGAGSTLTPVEITRHGRRELVLMSADHYDWLMGCGSAQTPNRQTRRQLWWTQCGARRWTRRTWPRLQARQPLLVPTSAPGEGSIAKTDIGGLKPFYWWAAPSIQARFSTSSRRCLASLS